MPGTIYTGTYVNGVILDLPAQQNPATVAASGVVGGTGSASGIYGTSGTAWTIANYGMIAGAPSYDGISLKSGGLITNASSSASIEGYEAVFVYSGAGTVINSGSLSGTSRGVDLRGGGAVTNNATGKIVAPVDAVLVSGGAGYMKNAGLLSASGSFASVWLQAGGNVANTGSIGGAYVDVEVTNGIGGLTNTGAMSVAATADHGWGVYLSQGGSVTNGVGGVIAVTGRFAPGVTTYKQSDATGIYIWHAPGTVINGGSISATGTWFGGGGRPYDIGEGVLLQFGGSVTNASSASISALLSAVHSLADATVVNSGQLVGTVAYGVTLDATGVVTNVTSGTIIGGFDGIRAVNATATVINDGFISGPQNYGIRLGANGSITNTANGHLTGGSEGVLFNAAGATLSNAGTITGAGTYRTTIGSGAYLGGGGNVANSGDIAGRLDGVFLKGAGTVVNSGTLTGTARYGVRVTAGGAVNNSGIVTGGLIGVDLAGSVAATLTNSGSISGTSDAVLFGAGNDTLIVSNGVAFTGTVDGGGGLNTLEFAAGGGTLTGIGSSVVNFGSIVFDPGAAWLVAGNASGLGGTISGFAPGDTIDLSGLHESVLNYAGSTLTLTGDATVTLTLPGQFTTQSFTAVADGAGTGTNLTVSCFVMGTSIETDDGETAVEHLCVGDRVRAVFDGPSAPVVWIGHRLVNCRSHPDPALVWPVRVRAGAIGPGSPRRDLWLSPDHAIWVRGALVPVRYLINGTSIEQVPSDSVTYYHIELPCHDLLIAQGLPAESYLDTGDRSSFDDDGALIALFPRFGGGIREALRCAPLLVTGAELAATRRHLARRAEESGWAEAVARVNLQPR